MTTVESLSYSVRSQIVGHYLGQLVFLVGLTKPWLSSNRSGVANTPSTNGADIHVHEIRSRIIPHPSAL